jgi:hypothetical protein
MIVATLTLGSRPRQRVARLKAKRKTRESHHMLLGVPKSVREWTLTLPSELPCWELDSQWTPKSSKRDYKGQNPSLWRVFYIIGKLLKCKYLKLNLHCPFGHLKHKLWPKERSGIKLTVWLLTIKSQESTQFPYVQAMCNIPLESSWRGIQLCFKPHRNQRSTCQVMCLQSCERPSCGNLGVMGQKAIWMWPWWRATKYTIKGKAVASPKYELWWILCVWVAHGSS